MRVTNINKGIIEMSVGPVLLTKLMFILAFQTKMNSISTRELIYHAE